LAPDGEAALGTAGLARKRCAVVENQLGERRRLQQVRADGAAGR